MGAVSGIWRHGEGTTPVANTSSADGSGSSDTSTATISANDFLTLLVTEMQNQDPTAATDPNEYINQLVNVNSLQQLISINQTLSSAIDPVNSESSGIPQRHASAGGLHGGVTGIPTAKSAGLALASVGTAQGVATRTSHGNLGPAKTSDAAIAIAHAFTKQ